MNRPCKAWTSSFKRVGFKLVKKTPPRSAPAAAEGPFRIQVVAERSGVPAATLRAWERRYGIPVPSRTSAAYRLYSLRDVENVRAMRELCDRGMSAAEAAKTVLSTQVAAKPTPLLADPIEEAKRRILEAAAALDAERLDAELMRMAYAGDAFTLYERVVAPLLVNVGNLWTEGQVSVAQEHFLSERLETMLRNSLALMRPQSGPLVLMACVAGEHHVLGLLGAALQFSGWGARPILLGADTPPDAIRDAVGRRRPAIVGLSVQRVPARPKTLFDEYATAMDGVPWIVGGEASEEIGPIVERAGGLIAPPRSASWQRKILELLRAERSPQHVENKS